MTKNNKGLVPIQNPSPKTTDSRNRTGSDLLIGWFNLAKPARYRQQKRGWRRNQRGQIDSALAGQLALLLVGIVLIVVGVAA